VHIEDAMATVKELGIIVGVCSICQRGGIELIYEDEHTVLQEHEAYGKHCNGSYSFPEITYRDKRVAQTGWNPANEEVGKLDDTVLTVTWEALLCSEPTGGDYRGVDYPTWCEIVYSEMDRRGLTHQCSGGNHE